MCSLTALIDRPTARERQASWCRWYVTDDLNEAWLIGEHRPSGEKKYYLANLPAKTGLRMLAAIIKAAKSHRGNKIGEKNSDDSWWLTPYDISAPASASCVWP